MKTLISDHDYELHLGGTAKPGIQKTLDCRGDLQHWMVAHDSAATWMMNFFTGSSLLLSLISTVASLPFFLFTLPTGALADRLDRQKLVCAINVCMAVTAFALAVLGSIFSILTSSWVACSLGFAINAPAWTSIVRQVVSDAELSYAATLGSLQFSIAGIIGPALGGWWSCWPERILSLL